MATGLTIERPAVDPAQAEAFLGKVLADLGGAFVTLLGGIGDRYGLFADLDTGGPATGAELAARTGVDPRYAREWLAALASAGYLDYDPASRRFALPPVHAAVLADEGGPFFVGGFYQQFRALPRLLDRLIEVFGRGGGVPLSA